MLILEDLKAELNGYRPQLDELHDVLAIEGAKEKLAELQMMVNSRDFGMTLRNHRKQCRL